jgi:hypothetical protein
MWDTSHHPGKHSTRSGKGVGDIEMREVIRGNRYCRVGDEERDSRWKD